MTGTLCQTPLTPWHAAHGGRMVDFAGWSMPVQYTSIVAEHQATRSAVGLFDVSHMGRFRLEGHDATAILDQLVTRRVRDMRPGQIRYSLVTRDDGGILDDVLVYDLGPKNSGHRYLMVVNAGNRQKIWNWVEDHSRSADAEWTDTTLDTAMIAVQGPRALEISRPLVELDVARLRYYHGGQTNVCSAKGLASRTGYTGEDGCELIVTKDKALEVWEKLHAAAGQFGGMAAGLGARDTLRLEAAMPLYGHELSEEIDPFQAGLGFAVDLDQRVFPGSDALAANKRSPGRLRRVGWELASKRVPREGYGVFDGNRQVGRVTSGTFSPTLNRPIAMGYVDVEFSEPGSEITIDIRGQREKASVAKLPFYRRPETATAK